MENLQKIDESEVSGKTMLEKKFFGSGEGDAPLRLYNPAIDEISREAPSGATHYCIQVYEMFFWGKPRWTCEVIFFKEKEAA